MSPAPMMPIFMGCAVFGVAGTSAALEAIGRKAVIKVTNSDFMRNLLFLH
jgi:hypothetical protein